MKNKISFVLFIFAALGCVRNAETDANTQVTPQGCPAVLRQVYHQVNLKTSHAPPQKVAIKFDGELKYDECRERVVNSQPPVVLARRLEGTILGVAVLHLGAYKTLPSDVSFEVLDRGDCTGEPLVFAAIEKLPLAFETTYPNGKECGGNTKAVVDVTVD